MTFVIKIEENFKQEAKAFDAMGKTLRELQRLTINELAVTAVPYQKREMPKDIDRPNPFTLNSMRYKKALGRQLESSIYVLPQQAEYLHRIVFTGTRVPLKNYIFIPSPRERTNRYGNMPRARRRRKLASPELFVKRRGTSLSAFERIGTSVSYVGQFVRRTNYRKKTWKFFEHNVDHVDKSLPRIVPEKWNRLMLKYNSKSSRQR